MAKKVTKKKAAATKRSISKNKKEIMGILNPKRRIGVAFLTFIATSLLCVSLYAGLATVQIANNSHNNVLGMTQSQKLSAIVAKAKSYSLSDKLATTCKTRSCAASKYQTAGDNNGYSSDSWSDCSMFVSRVMRDSGIDTNYENSGATTQLKYAQDETSLYTVTEITGKSKSWLSKNIKAGDIITISGKHTYISAAAGGASTYQASTGNQVPNKRGSVYEVNKSFSTSDKIYRIRIK